MNTRTLVLIGCGLLGLSTVHAQGLMLSGPDLGGQLTDDQVFSGFGCSGKNISPALEWSGTPDGTKSIAVTMYDPDAPTGSGWWHWLIFNISPDVKVLQTNAGNPEKNLAPEGSVQSRTDFGVTGFGGACPPEGAKPHAYIFTVFALDVESLDLDENASPALVGYMLNAHTLAKASLISYYNR